MTTTATREQVAATLMIDLDTAQQAVTHLTGQLVLANKRLQDVRSEIRKSLVEGL